MCVAALPALGAGVGQLFALSLGLTAATGLAQRSAAQAAANQTYRASVIANRSAEQAFAAQQEALAAQLKESRASKAQERMAISLRSLQAKGNIKTRPGVSGALAELLAKDIEFQAANQRESINQALESASRQYTRNVRGLEAQRDNRRNQLTSNINQAYNQIPTLGSTLLNVATQGLSTYGQLANL